MFIFQTTAHWLSIVLYGSYFYLKKPLADSSAAESGPIHLNYGRKK